MVRRAADRERQPGRQGGDELIDAFERIEPADVKHAVARRGLAGRREEAQREFQLAEKLKKQ